jgi:PAS domain S-box-containing protein
VDLQNLYWLQAVIAAALALFLTVYLWRHRATTAARLLIAVLLEMALWALAYALEYMSSGLAVRLFWVKFEYTGVAWLAPTFLAFSLCIGGLDNWVDWRRFWPLLLIPSITMVAAWTNSSHHLLWQRAWLDQSAPGMITTYSRGPVFWVFLTYSYLLLLVGSLVLLRTVWLARHLHRFSIGMLILGVGITWGVNALYLFRIRPFAYIDLTPLAFSIAAFLFTFGIFRAGLMHLIPLAREALMENLPDPVMVLDEQDRLVDINSAAQRFLGPQAPRLINQPITDIFSGQAQLKVILGSGLEGQTEMQLDCDGQRKIFEVRVSDLKNMHRASVGRYLIFRDITQRLCFQEELKRNEERYRTTFEHTGTAMMIAGSDTIITMVNSKYAELSGFSQAEIEGKMSWRDFVHPADLERMLGYHAKRRTSQEAPREYEFRFIDRWGNERWIDNTVELVPGTDLAVASLLDINDRKKAEESERASLRRLQRQRVTLVELSTHQSLAEGRMEESARVVSEAVARTMEAERVSIWLLSEDGSALNCLDSFSMSSQDHRSLPDLPVKNVPRYMQALQSERSLAAYDAQRDLRVSEFNDFFLKPNNIRSTMDAGIRLSGQVRGVICINQVGEQREWFSDENNFAAEVADQLAQALLNRERRQTQDALRESHERYSAFLFSLPDPLVVYDMQGRAQYLNAAFEETFGWTREELLDKRIDYVPAECIAETNQAIEDMKSGLQVRNLATKRFTKDGRMLDVNVSNSPYYGHDGNQAGNIVIIRDVTALAQAQAQLRESEERYRSLVENSPYGLLLANPASGRILYANHQLVRLFGYTIDEIENKSIWDVIDPVDFEIAQKRMKQRAEGELLDQGHVYTGRRKDGSRIRFKVTSALVQSKGEQVLQGIISDVTNEELMERQLHQAQKMEAVGTLAGGVAHEFNNLLMAIRGYSQLLTARENLEPRVREHLEKIAQTTRRAADLANTMLSFSRPETGQKEPVDLNQALGNVRGLLQGTLPPNIEQKVVLKADLPLLLANPNQLEQVFLNLAVNARDAMPAGGELILRTDWRLADAAFRASHNWASDEIYAEVTVEDTGNGMDEEVQARIFEPFYTTKEPGKGTGLGLFVAYSIITNHGGGIDVQSRPAQGTCFKIYLPADATLKREIFQPGPTEELPMGEGQQILVVDDEISLREITREALQACGYKTSEAANGREALERYEKNLRQGRPFDLVLLDLAMPVMDGTACFNQLLAMDPSARVIITTGHAHSQVDLASLANQPHGLIKKPFDLSNLLKEVSRALQPSH